MIKDRTLSLIFALLAIVTASHTVAATLTASVSTESDRAPLVEAIVTAHPVGFNADMPTPRYVLVDQIDKEFVNKTTLIWVGDQINFPNNDNIDHHVYSFSSTKQFELPLYREMPEHPILFDQPGVVTLGCNIHDWMVGYIYVADTPYAALTDANGQAVLNDLPAGDYKVRVWHEQLEQPEQETTQRVTIGVDNGAALEWSLRLKPVIRFRRAPMGIGRDY